MTTKTALKLGAKMVSIPIKDKWEQRKATLKIAAEILDDEIKLVFDEGIMEEQRACMKNAWRGIDEYIECHEMLDDMEDRMGVNVHRVRELLG